MTLVDVVYIPAPHARRVKNELESLGLLDGRYKMVRASGPGAGGGAGNLVAIPVTGRVDAAAGPPDGARRPTAESAPGDAADGRSFRELVVGSGTEAVPFSSSYTAKMKQGRGLRSFREL